MSKKHVQELQKARKRIKNNENSYICDALRRKFTDKGYDPENPYSNEAKEIKKEIHIAISGAWSVTDWLIKQGFDTGGNYSPKMREYRLAWIDQMIEYWKDKK